MGFEAPPGTSPQDLGERRIAWMLGASDERPLNRAEDPLPERLTYVDSRPPKVREFVDACSTDSAECAAAFATSAPVLAEWAALDGSLLDRYEELIARTEWREFVVDLNAPWPSYASAVNAQRFLLLKASALAEQGDAAAVNALLAADGRFWRTVLASADQLITKMIAAAALTRHFEWGNLVLRKLAPVEAARATPAEWRTEIADSERSMRRCLIGEWIFVSTTLAKLNDGGEESVSLADRASGLIGAPFFQRQDTLNDYAEYYALVSDALDAPLAQYRAAVDRATELALRTADEAFPPRTPYNVMGAVLMASGVGEFGGYAGRVADVEGTRRAALAAVTLRTEGVSAGGAEAWLSAAALRNPYDDRPLIWDETDKAVVFRGLEPGERGEHRLYY
jgi:hypothetical protein